MALTTKVGSQSSEHGVVKTSATVKKQNRWLPLLQGESRMAGRTDGFVAAYFGRDLLIRFATLTDDPYPAAFTLLEHIEPHKAAAGVLAIPRSR